MSKPDKEDLMLKELKGIRGELEGIRGILERLAAKAGEIKKEDEKPKDLLGNIKGL